MLALAVSRPLRHCSRNATLSSLCRLRDISLRPEGVFQSERQEPFLHDLAPTLGELSPKVTERVSQLTTYRKHCDTLHFISPSIQTRPRRGRYR